MNSEWFLNSYSLAAVNIMKEGNFKSKLMIGRREQIILDWYSCHQKCKIWVEIRHYCHSPIKTASLSIQAVIFTTPNTCIILVQAAMLQASNIEVQDLRTVCRCECALYWDAVRQVNEHRVGLQLKRLWKPPSTRDVSHWHPWIWFLRFEWTLLQGFLTLMPCPSRPFGFSKKLWLALR